MKEKNYERELPAGYSEVLHINAKDAKLGIILNVIALAVMAIVMVLAVIPMGIFNDAVPEWSEDSTFTKLLIGFAGMYAYIILHELVDGIAYRTLTGERLTFGISWSCAFCGVPGIYTYRRTALISVAAPLTVFTLIFIPLTVVLFFLDPVYYLISAAIFGMHLGGCSGDMYVIYLFMTKFKSKRALMRDTGPEQFFYLPEEN